MNLICAGWYMLQAIICAVIAGQFENSWYTAAIVFAVFMVFPTFYPQIARMMPAIGAAVWGLIAWSVVSHSVRTDFAVVATLFAVVFGAGVNIGAIEYMTKRETPG